ETADWRGFLPINPFLAVAIGEVTVVICLISGNRFPKVKRRFRIRAAAKFPFRFSRQAIRLLIFFPQLLDELLAIPPRNLVHWQALLALEMAGVVAHHRLPLFLRDEVDAHVEPFGQRDLVLDFVVASFRFAVWTTHQERARWNPDELHAEAVGERLRRPLLIWWLAVRDEAARQIARQSSAGGNENEAEETFHGR